jgi:hypothetical protein
MSNRNLVRCVRGVGQLCHARSAVGMAELPHGIPLEINGVFELKA